MELENSNLSECRNVGRTFHRDDQKIVRPSDKYKKGTVLGSIQAQNDLLKLSDAASDNWGLSDGIRVWHPGGCPRCPETHVYNLAFLIPVQSNKDRPQTIICGRCGRELINAGFGWVYYVASIGGEIKIGYATDLVSRIRSLQIGNPHALHLVAIEAGNLELESIRHEQFAHQRGMWGEWFYPGSDLVEHTRSVTYVDLPFFELSDALRRVARA